MSNKYGIPEARLKKIRERDNTCVYCHKTMNDPSNGGFKGDWTTIEHLHHDPSFYIDPDTVAIVICCGSCNSSRRDKALLAWFKTQYCIERNITTKTVTKPVKEFIKIYYK